MSDREVLPGGGDRGQSSQEGGKSRLHSRCPPQTPEPPDSQNRCRHRARVLPPSSLHCPLPASLVARLPPKSHPESSGRGSHTKPPQPPLRIVSPSSAMPTVRASCGHEARTLEPPPSLRRAAPACWAGGVGQGSIGRCPGALMAQAVLSGAVCAATYERSAGTGAQRARAPGGGSEAASSPWAPSRRPRRLRPRSRCLSPWQG